MAEEQFILWMSCLSIKRYNIIEAGGELEHEDLIRLHEEAEQKLIAEAEQRKKARAEEKRRKKEQHDFYDLLRM